MTMERIVLASGNHKKLQELQAILPQHTLRFVPQGELGIDDAVEDGLSFVENAIIKARHASRLSGLPAIADDSGLVVDALGGQPGIHSARFANPTGTGNSSDADNNALLLDLLRNVPPAQRGARFHCIIALLRHADDPMPLICQGSWEGRILDAPRGSQGFGYDPLFFVPTEGCSSAELPTARKHALSHRGQALRALQAHWPWPAA